MEQFQAERATLARLRPRLAERHEGQFAVLFGDRLVGVFPTSRDAYRAGLHAAGVDLARPNGETPLVVAAEAGHLQVVKALRDAGASKT